MKNKTKLLFVAVITLILLAVALLFMSHKVPPATGGGSAGHTPHPSATPDPLAPPTARAARNNLINGWIPPDVFSEKGMPSPQIKFPRGTNASRRYPDPNTRALPLDLSSRPPAVLAKTPADGRLFLLPEETDLHTLTSRRMVFDPTALEDVIAGRTSRLLAPTTGDEVLTVEFQSVKTRSADSSTLLGRVAGEEETSDVLMVYHDGVIHCQIARYSKSQHLEYRILADGHMMVRELDSASMTARCGNGQETACDAVHDETSVEGTKLAPQEDPIVAQETAGWRTIDVVVGYSQGARVADGGYAQIEARIIASVDRMTTAFANSQIPNTETMLLGTIEDPDYVFPGAAGQNDELVGLQNFTDGVLDTVSDYYTLLGADMVSFVQEQADGSAGLAYLPGRSSVVSRDYMASNRITFAHELGHSLGCDHSWGDSSQNYHARYGWRIDLDGNPATTNDRYRTIMAYDWGWERIPYFSNPNVSYNGAPTGAPNGHNVQTDTKGDQRYYQGGVGYGGSDPNKSGFDGTNPTLGANNANTINTGVGNSSYGATAASNRSTRTTFNVISPVAGSFWESGDSMGILFRGGDHQDLATIELFKGGVLQSTLATGLNPATRRNFPWTLPTVIASGADYMIRVTLNPGTPGSIYADSGFFTITGAPLSMAVARSGSPIGVGGADGVSGTFSGTGTQLTYTISNTGNGQLVLTTPVAISGQQNCSVTVNTQPASPVNGGASTNLVATVTPASGGTWSFNASIANNDPEKAPYHWTVTGIAGSSGTLSFTPTADTYIDNQSTGTNHGTVNQIDLNNRTSAPNKSILQGLLRFDLSSIPSGSTIDSATLDFVQDNGNSGSVNILEATASWGETTATWANANANYGATTFGSANTGTTAGAAVPTITLNAAGRSKVQSWVNNSAVNYGFGITTSYNGNGTFLSLRSREHATPAHRPRLTITYSNTSVNAPLMIVSGNDGVISNGGSDSIPGTRAGGATHLTYTISNLGTTNLSMTTPVTATAQSNCSITVNTQPSNTVAASGSTDLALTVTPSGTGSWSATVSIANNDADKAPYAWTISGSASVSQTVTYDGNYSGGGTAPIDAQSPYIAGSTVTVLGNSGNLTVAGFAFDGWNTAANGSGTAYAPGATFTMPDSDVTLYAVWNAVQVVVYQVSMDTDPGWTRQGEWQYGTPTGGGGSQGGNPDPTSGATGTKVFGINLSGDYSTTVGGPFYLTTGAINMSGHTGTVLRFKRWLNADFPPYVTENVQVSNNGTTWTTLFTTVAGTEVTDSAWGTVEYDISAVADGRSSVYVRWGHQIGDGSAYKFSGWNIDDVELLGKSTTLANALDTTGLNWTKTGNADWFPQAATTHDGVDAAQSGQIADNQSSSMETTVIGPASLTFWWKVSSEANNDFLRFYLDGAEQPGALAGISGLVDWTQKTVVIPAGNHTVKWAYIKNSSVSSNADTAWVDQVYYSPLPEIAVEQPVSTALTDGSANISFGTAAIGSPSPLTFTVRNTGTADLTGLALTKDGTQSVDYTVGSLGATTLAPGASTTFTVTFTPGAAGARTAAIHLASNDADENPFDINLTGTGNTPPTFSGFSVSTPYQTAATISLGKLLTRAADADDDALGVTAAGSSANAGTATLQASSILYTPPVGFSGNDTFPVTITDARGASVVGTVTVNVESDTGIGLNAPTLTSLPGGQMGLGFQGIPGRTYQIQRSTNLSDWEALATIVAEANGSISFVDESPPQPNAFYRIRKP